MQYRRIAQFLILIFALTFSACSLSYALTIEPAKQSDAPKCQTCKRYAMHIRDSVFHSYMDSLDFRIHALNDVARKVDSLARILNSKGHVSLHLDGKTLGPLRIPKFTIPEISIPEWDVEVPEITVPEIEVPKIEMPDIDIQVDGSISDSDHADGSLIVTGSSSGEMAELQGPGLRLHLSPSEYTLHVNSFEYPKHYYLDRGRRYYIENPLWAQVTPPVQGPAKAWPVDK